MKDKCKKWLQEIFIDGLSGMALGLFSTLIIGKDAYGVTDIEGGAMEVIVHDKGQIGGPLNQFSTVGWKAMQTAEILVENYLARIESCSDKYSEKVSAN